MFAIVDWQQLAALIIVGTTACAFVASKLRRRRFTFQRDTACGCGSAPNLGVPQTICYSARKGERPKITVKNL
jgi:hypothetical protein